MHLRVALVRAWLVLACGLAPACTALAQGTIAYYQPAQPLSPLVGREVDLNGDGQAEVRFSAVWPPAVFYGTEASGIGSARLLVTPPGPHAFGSYLVGLNEGFLIGGATDPSVFWAAHDAPRLYGNAIVLGSYLPEEGPLVPDGLFYGTTAFMGIQFQIGSDWHYGWARIRGGVAGPSDDGQEFYLNPPGWILDWAYETRPDTPIFAGAVPEPSTWALLGTGAFLFWWYGRRKQRG
jgi:hypothetical protein